MDSDMNISPTAESRDQFDRQAQMYAVSSVHRSGASLPILVDYAAAKPGERALDVATGTGNTAFAIAEQGAEVVGIDVSTGMLVQANARAVAEGYGNIAFQEGNAESIPFEEGAFDLVTARHAPHHFRDVERFLAEVKRVLRSEGRFVMADGICASGASLEWFDRWQRLRDPSHYFSRTIEQWQAFAEAAGFRWVRHTTVGYRMEFEWWVGNAGTSAESVELLREHAKSAPKEFQDEISLEFVDGEVHAFTETMMVVRLEPA